MEVPTYQYSFNKYVETVFQVEVDLRFWKHFMGMSIDNYQNDNPVNRWINDSGFAIYNLSSQKDKHGHLWLSPISKKIEIDDLKYHQNEFFNWIMNMALARIYNSIELLLLSGIQLSFFPNLMSPHMGKKYGSSIIKAIKDDLKTHNIQVDAKNNRYLIDFFKFKSANCTSFLEKDLNVDMKTSWSSFFEMISTLRNIIVHEEMAITKNLDNHLNSIAGEAYRFFFKNPQFSGGLEYITPFDSDRFLFLTSRINDFAANMIKFAASEIDFKFIGLHSA